MSEKTFNVISHQANENENHNLKTLDPSEWLK